MELEMGLNKILKFCGEHKIEFEITKNIEETNHINYDSNKRLIINVSNLENKESVREFSNLLEIKLNELKNLFK